MALNAFLAPGAEQHVFHTLAQHQLKVRRLQAVINPQIAYGAAQLAEANPSLDAGVVAGMAMAGMRPDDPVMDLVSERSAYIDDTNGLKNFGKNGGIFGEWVWNPFKGLVRGAFLGLEGMMQEAESLFVRTPVGMFQGEPFGTAWSKAGRSDAYYALQKALGGDRVSLGTGFFAQNQSYDDTWIQEQLAQGHSLAETMASREYRDQFAQQGVDISQMGEAQRSQLQLTSRQGNKSPVSLGRLAAIQVAEPGTMPFHMLSGLVDAGKQIWLDPSNLALGGVGKAAKLRKLLYTTEELADPTFLSKAMQGLKAGLLPNAARKTILARTVDEFFDLDRQGQAVVKWLTDETSAPAIYRLLRRSQHGRTVDPKLAQALADTSDPREIRTIMKAAYEGPGAFRDVVKAPGGTRAWMDANIRPTGLGNYLGRMAAVTNSRVLDINDRHVTVDIFDNYLRNLGLPEAAQTQLLDAAIRIDTENFAVKYAGELGQQDLYGQYFELVKAATEQWVDMIGIPFDSPLRGAMTKMFDTPDAYRSFWVDNLGNDVLFGGANVVVDWGGVVHAKPSAVMFSQFLNQGIPLPDSRKIRAAMRHSFVGRVAEDSKSLAWLKKLYGEDDWAKVGDHALVNALDWSMSNLWKPSVLLRVAWPVRVIGEEQIRLSGKLMAGMFNHPIQYMALLAAKDRKFLGRAARMADDVFMQSLADDAAQNAAMSTQSANIAEALTGKQAGIKGAGHRWEAALIDDMNDEEFLTALMVEYNQVIKDDVATEIARVIDQHLKAGGELTANEDVLAVVKEAFWNGELKHLRERMLRDSGRWDLLNSKEFAQGYIDTVYGKITHLGGGDGFMTDPWSKRWHNFDGTELSPSDVRNRLGVGGRGPTNTISITDDFPETAMAELEQQLRNIYGEDEGMRRFMMLDTQWDEYSALTNDPYEATALVIEDARAMVENAASQGLATGHQMEYFASWEARWGIGRLAQNRERMGRMYQTIGSEQLAEGNIASALTMHTYDYNDGLRLAESLQGRAVPVEDINGIEAINLSLAPYVDRVYNTSRHTYVRYERGVPTALVEISRDAEGIRAVDYVAGATNTSLKALADELIESGELSVQDLFDMNSGRISFKEWLLSQGVEEARLSEPELWRYLDDNPDALDRFMAHMEGTPPYQVPIPGTHPGLRGTSRTFAGGRMTGAITRRAAREATEWDQSIPHFLVEKPADPRIFELVANKQLVDPEGKVLLDWGMERATTNKGVRAQFKARKDYFAQDIEGWRARSPKYLRRPVATAEARDIRRWDEGVNVMMQMLMGKPTDYLSRSPAFRQFYWQRAAEMASHLGEEDRKAFILAAENANLLQTKDAAGVMGKALRTLRRYTGTENTVDEAIRHVNNLVGKPAVVAEGAITSLADLDNVAKAYALEEVKQLLYDLSKKHNFTDQMRFIMPFGEAWYEVVSTWAKLMKENPRNIRRLQQGIEGLRGSDPFRGVGPDGEQGRGFFFNDPTSGDEVFAYPGLGLIPSWMPFFGGASQIPNLQLTGRVSGLNIMGQIMPGIGPVLQVPLSQLGYFDDVNNPNRALRDIIMPFGKSEMNITDPGTWLSPILPRWVNKGLQAWGVGSENNQRLYANTVIDVYKTLLMTGQGSDDTPDEMAATLKRARELAGDLSRVRALASFAAPAGTTQLWEVTYDPKDREGDIWAYSNLATAYRQILDENQGDEVRAFKNFIDIFGIDPMLFTVAKTQKVLPRAVTLEARAWEQKNKDLFEQNEFPLTAYFAHPDPPEGEFDYETYLLQLESDSRQPLTPEQWALKRNQFLGRVGYANMQRQADRRFDNAEQKTLWLRGAHSSLQVMFPGYGQPIAGLPERPGLDAEIAELQRWAEEPRLADTEAGKALVEYLAFRQNVVRLTLSKLGYTSPTGFRTGKLSAVYRMQLRARGQALVSEYPEFLSVWQQILSRELEEPQATLAPVNLAGVTF